jgi:hypothetical protein
MPIHDWTRVSAGTFHDFHLVWTAELRTALNDGILPPDYYAQAEQVTGPFAPDVLALEYMPAADDEDFGGEGDSPDGTAVATLAKTAPKVRVTEEMEHRFYRNQRRRIAIRHSSDDRVVALIEIVSPGNKESTPSFTAGVALPHLKIDLSRPLIDMPLFLTPELYVNVPLEGMYSAAYRGVPRRWKQVLERPTAQPPP